MCVAGFVCNSKPTLEIKIFHGNFLQLMFLRETDSNNLPRLFVGTKMQRQRCMCNLIYVYTSLGSLYYVLYIYKSKTHIYSGLTMKCLYMHMGLL